MECGDEADVGCYHVFAAMGTEPRVRILQVLLSGHAAGLVVGEIHDALGMGGSTLSHHLDKLKNEGPVRVQSEGTFLRYSANAETLHELLTFLCRECCTRSRAVGLSGILERAKKA